MRRPSSPWILGLLSGLLLVLAWILLGGTCWYPGGRFLPWPPAESATTWSTFPPTPGTGARAWRQRPRPPGRYRAGPGLLRHRMGSK
jgi:hypothetical protein